MSEAVQTGASAASALSDPQKLQLVVGNFVQKACEMVLHSRMVPLPPTLRRGSVNRWFNVESEELLTLHDDLEQWRLDISQPLQLDVYVDATDEPLIRGALGLTPHEPTTVRSAAAPSGGSDGRSRVAHASQVGAGSAAGQPPAARSFCLLAYEFTL